MRKPRRTTFRTSRATEYFDIREVEAQTGQPLQNFATAGLKELVDNVLDACETIGVASEARCGCVSGSSTMRANTVCSELPEVRHLSNTISQCYS